MTLKLLSFIEDKRIKPMFINVTSHGAGHALPVNSGKLLVTSSLCRASFHNPLKTRSFHDGMMLPSGQPV